MRDGAKGNTTQNRKGKRPAGRKYGGRRRQKQTNRPGLDGLVQSTTNVARKQFGAGSGPLRKCMDATHSAHLSLPRAIGPYTVTHVTKIIQSSAAVILFGTFRSFDLGPDAEHWSNVVAIGCVDENSSISAPNNAYRWAFNQSGLQEASITPSAVSVSCMNPQAVQTTTGIVYGGRCKTQLKLHDSTDTWTSFANDYVAFNGPRLMSAAKLAMAGVSIDAVPYNMAALSDFRELEVYGDTVFSWNGSTSTLDSEGFAPVVWYNPNKLPLQFIVTVECRTRFPVQHVAQSSHRHHPPASDTTWARLQQMMAAEGHGVKDTRQIAGK